LGACTALFINTAGAGIYHHFAHTLARLIQNWYAPDMVAVVNFGQAKGGWMLEAHPSKVASRTFFGLCGVEHAVATLFGHRLATAPLFVRWQCEIAMLIAGGWLYIKQRMLLRWFSSG